MTLLVDYSKEPARLNEDFCTMVLPKTAQANRRRPCSPNQEDQTCFPETELMRRHESAPATASTSSSSSTTALADQALVTFQLRRNTSVDQGRIKFMTYMKNHFSDSDLDMKQAEANDAQLPESSSDRRDLLKRTLSGTRSRSYKHFPLDTRPIDSNATTGTTTTPQLPHRSRSFNTNTNSVCHVPEFITTTTTTTTTTQQAKTTATSSSSMDEFRAKMRHACPTRQNSLKQALGTKEETDTSYLPRKLLQTQSLHVKPSDRRMMLVKQKSQQSFVTGSRIRHIRG